MKISKQEQREAKQLFRCCLTEGRLDESRTRQVVQALIERKPRGYLGILTHLQRLVRLELDSRMAIVESAVPLSASLQASVRENLNRQHGQGLEVRFKENPRLLGGLRIQVGSNVYDGSVLARLASLQESL